MANSRDAFTAHLQNSADYLLSQPTSTSTIANSGKSAIQNFNDHYSNSSEYALANLPTGASANRSFSDAIQAFKDGINNPVEPSPNSGIDTTGMWKLYDPTWNGTPSASQISDPSDREKMIQTLAPYSTLFGMDVATQYQEALASTSHQREVADLKAAGLNPVLSANGGSGSSVFSGSYAPVLSSGSGGSGGFSPGSGKDGDSIGEKLSSLNWRSAASSIGYAIGSAFGGNIAGAISNTITGVVKLFS